LGCNGYHYIQSKLGNYLNHVDYKNTPMVWMWSFDGKNTQKWKLKLNQSINSLPVNLALTGVNIPSSMKVSGLKVLNPGIVEYKNKIWITDRNKIWSSNNGKSWNLVKESSNFESRVSANLIVFKNELWIIGGRSGSRENRNIYKSRDGINWKKVSTIKTNILSGNSFKAVVMNNKIWIVNGDKSKIISSVNGIDWNNILPKPKTGKNTTGFSFLTFKNRLWIIGGVHKTYSNVSWRSGVYSSADGINWVEEIKSNEFPFMSNFISVVYDNKIWIIGGSKYKNSLSKTIYYLDNGKKLKLANDVAISKRRNGVGITFKNGIWIYGGYTGGNINKMYFIKNKNIKKKNDKSLVLKSLKNLCPSTIISGDLEFAGNGPHIKGEVELIISSDKKSIYAVTKFNAKETNLQKSEVEGSWIKTVYSSTNGLKIKSIRSVSKTTFNKILIGGGRNEMFQGGDGDRHILLRGDKYLSKSGPVKKMIVVGDTGGTDISTDNDCNNDTRIELIEFDPIIVEFE